MKKTILPAPCRHPSLRATVFAFASACFSPAVFGQTTAPSSPPADASVVELSPFVITADSNVGYLATATLAGTRLKTDLRDLGAAITVVTPEFMKDTGVTNIEELLPYTTSTEIGGVFGNYSAAGLADNAGRPDNDSVRRDPQSGARVRGFASPAFTRGYFSTSIATDAYNVGSITMNRGANSLLFGLGSAGGVIESSPSQGIIGQNAGSAVFRYGSHGSNRSTLDYNATVIPNRLAVRIDGLNKTDNYQQEPAFDRERRVYVALNAVLFENKNSNILGKTIIRGNFEAGTGKRTPPTSMAPTVAYAPFFLPPPNFEPYTGQDYIAGGGYAMLAANWKKWAVNDTRRIQATAAGVTPVRYIAGWYEALATAVAAGRPDLVSQNYSSSHIFDQLGVVFNGSGTATIGIPGSNLQAFQGWVSQETAAPVLTNAFTNSFINTRAYQDGNQNVGFKSPTLHDPNVFDYRNRLITGGLQEINRRFDAHSVTFEQSFFKNRLGFEGTLDKQFFHIDSYQPFGGGVARNVPIYVDTSLYLSNGSPNPNVGRAFMTQTIDTEQSRNTYRDNQRVTAFLDLNAKDLNPTLGQWLGRHTFTGLWQKESVVTQGLNYAMYWTGNNFNINQTLKAATTDATLRNIRANPAVIFAYLSDDLRGKEMNEVRLNGMSITRMQDGDSFNTTYYDRTSGTFKTGSVMANRVPSGATASGTDVTSKALAWQSRLLSNNLIGLVGWREDTIENFRAINTGRASPLNNAILPEAVDLNNTPATTQKGKTFTWSAVGHLPQRVLEKLPRIISSASAHYGVSENFQAIAERHDVNGNTVESPKGTTTEYGMTLGFQDNKWLLKVNHFESASANVGVLTNPNIALQSITEVTRPLGNYQAALNTGVQFNQLSSYPALQAAGYTSYDQLFAAIKNFIPEPARSAYDYRLNPNNNTWELPPGTGFQNVTATSDVVSKGWEVELTANPTKAWRVSFNAAQVEAITSNSGPELAAFQAAYIKNMNDAKLAGVVDGPASITTMIGRYNVSYVAPLVQQRAKDGAASQELRKYRVNLVSRYEFKTGRLKGFGLGGAVRWQSAVAIGYATRLNSDIKQVPILDQPFFGPAELNGDAWLSYGRKLTEKIRWEVQLNARNLVGSQQDIPLAADPDGNRSVYRIAPEKAWYLTNTFSF